MYVENLYKMKNYLISSLVVVLLICPIVKTYAQPIKAPMFGKDITINNDSNADQRNVKVCVAPNGWLYSCYWNHFENGFTCYIMKSTDNGISWTKLANLDYPNTEKEIADLEILACGTDETNMKLFFGQVFIYFPSYSYQGVVIRINGNTGELEDEILHDESDVYDIALASDYPYQVGNANPFSLAVLYSRTRPTWYMTELIYCASSDGGQSFDHTQIISSSIEDRFFHVDLSYAWSPTKNTGRYYGVWEVKNDFLDPTGHIYTAHTEPYYDSPFSQPVCLDSLLPELINNCKLPTIACQQGETENVSSDISQVVLCEFKSPQSGNCNVVGWYNKESTNSTTFSPIALADTTHYNCTPDIAYNNIDNTFMVTYFDSTSKQLPLITNDLNLTNPTNWNQISAGYNDSPDILYPNPCLKMNHSQGGGMNAWIMDKDGNGVALFDAVKSTYTSTENKPDALLPNSARAIPNPCNASTLIRFESANNGSGKLNIYSNTGQIVESNNQLSFTRGINNHLLNTSHFAAGYYMVEIQLEECILEGKFMVIH